MSSSATEESCSPAKEAREKDLGEITQEESIMETAGTLAATETFFTPTSLRKELHKTQQRISQMSALSEFSTVSQLSLAETAHETPCQDKIQGVHLHSGEITKSCAIRDESLGERALAEVPPLFPVANVASMADKQIAELLRERREEGYSSMPTLLEEGSDVPVPKSISTVDLNASQESGFVSSSDVALEKQAAKEGETICVSMDNLSVARPAEYQADQVSTRSTSFSRLSFSSKKWLASRRLQKKNRSRHATTGSEDGLQLSDVNKSARQSREFSGTQSRSEGNMLRDASFEEQPAVLKTTDAYGRTIMIKTLMNGKYEITAGTLEALVNSLAEASVPDTLFIEVFLLTFRHFAPPTRILELLRQRFQQEQENSQTAALIRLRVVNVLKKWTERHAYDFRFPEMQAMLLEFLQIADNSECAKFTNSIRSLVQAELERSKTFVAPPKLEAEKQVQSLLTTVDFLHSWSAKKYAQVLTLGDLHLFKQIQPEEFCVFLWGDKNDPRTLNFRTYIDRFNRIGFWVSTVICSYKEDVRKRAETIDKFIHILKYCYKYRNFNTAMAVLSGLNTTAVSRLKKTWALVEKSSNMSFYKEMEARMSYRGNFKAYRELENTSKLPFLPFFGLYVKDLTFMNDGNQKHLNLLPANVTVSQQYMMQGKRNSTTTMQTSCTMQSQKSGTSLLKEELFALMDTCMNETTPLTTLPEDAPPLPPVINFEKCRSINEKIHALRIFQQSVFKFSAEEKEEREANATVAQSFLQSFRASSTSNLQDLETYCMHPFGPPAITDEMKVLEMSRECEPSGPGGYRPTSTTSRPCTASKVAAEQPLSHQQ